jgi:hypothetical protein
MAAEVPLPPFDTPAFDRRKGIATAAALRILIAYLGIHRNLARSDPDMAAAVIAEEIEALCPSDTFLAVNGFRAAETAFGDPEPGYVPAAGPWRSAARPVLLRLCPPAHADAALIMMDKRITAETVGRHDVDAWADDVLKNPVATIHAEAALRSWLFTQSGFRAGLQADVKMTEFLLRR